MPSTPHPRSPWRLHTPWLALAVTLIVAVMLGFTNYAGLARSLGDTDDAMRLVMVRQFLTGQSAWYDMHMARIQPPLGTDLHWSRLVDAGIASLMWLFGLALPPAQAETTTRLVWPLLWIFPAAWAVLAMARRLGGSGAALLAGLFLITTLTLYFQWRPGRIDHHNIQIALSLIALAGVMDGRRRGAVIAGLASGLGLAVGLEAALFLALVGALFALAFAARPDLDAPRARAYGLTLAGSTAFFFLAQTAPHLWLTPLCDALAINFLTATVIAGVGLWLCGRFTANQPLAIRLAALAVVGALAAGAYLVMAPVCLGGPMAQIDPRVKPIWLDFVIEMRPMLSAFSPSRPDAVAAPLILMVLGALSWLWLGRKADGRTLARLALGLGFFLATVIGVRAFRMSAYAAWFAIPLIAAAIAEIAGRLPRMRLLGAVLIALAVSPMVVTRAIESTGVWRQPKTTAQAKTPPDRCMYTFAYRRLARLPKGLVLSEIDVGPYVLAHTAHSAVSAPYHRASRGVLEAYAALSATPGPDEVAVRRLGATYVVACPARADRLTHSTLPASSLQTRLDRGVAPAWLEALSKPGEPLQIYRVRPAD